MGEGDDLLGDYGAPWNNLYRSESARANREAIEVARRGDDAVLRVRLVAHSQHVLSTLFWVDGPSQYGEGADGIRSAVVCSPTGGVSSFDQAAFSVFPLPRSSICVLSFYPKGPPVTSMIAGATHDH